MNILAVILAATAPMATRQAATNIAEHVVAEATPGIVAAAVAAVPAPDYSTGNTQLVATIEATAPAPGNYAAVSNAAMKAASRDALADATNTLNKAKQDKLPFPTNAIPQSVISGLSAALAGKLDKTGGTVMGLTVEDASTPIFSIKSANAEASFWIDGTNILVTVFNFNTGSISSYHFNRVVDDEVAVLGDLQGLGVDLSPATNYTDSATNALSASLSSRLSLASLAATNYTDAAVRSIDVMAGIAATNTVFSNAVLAVGLNIDTNTVAAINALVEAGDELPIGGAATVGGLLLALAAAVAALKRTKADASALRYAMPAAVALTPSGDAATLVCADRAVTNATIASGFSTLNLTFPAAVSGYVRDFYLRITVAAGESAPAISVPQGVTIENAGGAVPEIADGEASAAATTLVWFSETAPGVFTAKSETVSAVA